MIYVFRTKPSAGAISLAAALDGRRIRQRENMDRLARPGDTVVCWGEHFSKPGVTVLNGGAFKTKFEDALTLRAGNIRTIEVSPNRPQRPGTLTPIPDPAIAAYQAITEAIGDYEVAPDVRSPVTLDGICFLSNKLGTYLDAVRQPAPPPIMTPTVFDPLYVGRMNNHVGGTDLLVPPLNPDYWVKKETITEEYRLHMFDGKSIRAGKKAPRRDATNQSDWIRSYDGGWRIIYDKYESTIEQRTVASMAVRALGLTFGAVDLGLLANGGIIVLEVNRAPGLEGGTIEAYARGIEGWEERQVAA